MPVPTEMVGEMESRRSELVERLSEVDDQVRHQSNILNKNSVKYWSGNPRNTLLISVGVAGRRSKPNHGKIIIR